MAVNRQLGGWYNNPATGRNQRWWGDYGWTDGSDPTQGGGGGASTQSTDPVSDFADVFGKLVGSPIELPPITTRSWEEYETQSLEELKPYYERILKEEGGDVERAKSRIEQDYKRGIRINREDYEAQKAGYGAAMKPGESAADYYNRTKNVYGTDPQEGVALLGNLNKRGILNSGIANVDASTLQSTQQRRQEALDRAIQRYEEQAGITRSRGIEDQDVTWGRRQFELGEKRKEQAGILARQKRSDEVSTQEIERENLMRKAIQNVYS